MPWDIGDDDVGQELVGAELVGDDELEAILGAKRAARRRGAFSGGGLSNQAQALAMAFREAQSRTLLSKRPYTMSRELILPIDSVATVGAGLTVLITPRPQKRFRAERIIVGSSIAAFFLVNDVKVGNVSQFLQSGAIPAEVFSQNAFGVRLKMDTASPALDFVISVTNIDVAAHRFNGAVIGEVVA
jgi:hypothetical protein